MIQNHTDNKKTNYSINTMGDQKSRIEKILAELQPVKAIELVERIGKELRQTNSRAVTSSAANRKIKKIQVDERPDEIELKA